MRFESASHLKANNFIVRRYGIGVNCRRSLKKLVGRIICWSGSIIQKKLNLTPELVEFPTLDVERKLNLSDSLRGSKC